MFRFRLLPRVAARLLSEPSLPLGSVAGLRLRAHASALLTAVVTACALARALGGLVGGTDLAVALFASAVTLAVFLSLGARCAAGAFAGGVVRTGRPRAATTLTFYLFGTAARGDAPQSCREELVSGAAGLVTSVTLALGGAAVWIFAGSDPTRGVLATGAALFSVTNALIASIHLFPAFPLDGGRILRAALWRVGGCPVRATWLAARNTRWFALAMIGVGIVTAARGSGIGAVLVLVGWFVGESAHGAAESARSALVRERFAATEPPPYARSSLPSVSLGPERAGRRHVANPSKPRTTTAGTLPSTPNDPPVHREDPSDRTSSSDDDV
jgi:Zn-dependent protease